MFFGLKPDPNKEVDGLAGCRKEYLDRFTISDFIIEKPHIPNINVDLLSLFVNAIKQCHLLTLLFQNKHKLFLLLSHGHKIQTNLTSLNKIFSISLSSQMTLRYHLTHRQHRLSSIDHAILNLIEH